MRGVGGERRAGLPRKRVEWEREGVGWGGGSTDEIGRSRGADKTKGTNGIASRSLSNRRGNESGKKEEGRKNVEQASRERAREEKGEAIDRSNK